MSMRLKLMVVGENKTFAGTAKQAQLQLSNMNLEGQPVDPSESEVFNVSLSLTLRNSKVGTVQLGNTVTMVIEDPVPTPIGAATTTK